MTFSRRQRVLDELAQAWAIAIKDVRVYYLKAPMIMFGLLLPFFLFFSFIGNNRILRHFELTIDQKYK